MKASVNAIFGFGAKISKRRDVSDFGTVAFSHCIAITAFFSFTFKDISSNSSSLGDLTLDHLAKAYNQNEPTLSDLTLFSAFCI